MRTKGPVVVAYLVTLAALVVASGSVLAQRNVAGDDWYEIGLRGESILRFPPVVDAPFSADVLTVWRPKPNTGRSELRATSRYYRTTATGRAASV